MNITCKAGTMKKHNIVTNKQYVHIHNYNYYKNKSLYFTYTNVQFCLMEWFSRNNAMDFLICERLHIMTTVQFHSIQLTIFKAKT